MECYQCLQNGINRDAVGLCHHCSAALCSEHIFAVEEPLMVKHLMVPATVFPKKARLMLCGTCKMALEQLQDESAISTEVCR
jgi:hypothetical protein